MNKRLSVRGRVISSLFAATLSIGLACPFPVAAQTQTVGTPSQNHTEPERHGIKLSEWIRRLKPNTDGANNAASVLIEFGESGAPATVPLAKLLNEDQNADVRRHAASALWSIGSKAKAATPALRSAVAREENPSVRMWAARALARIAPARTGEAVDALVKLLHKEYAYLDRRNAADGLGEIGPKARKAVPELEIAANDTNTEVAQAARDALKKIQAP